MLIASGILSKITFKHKIPVSIQVGIPKYVANQIAANIGGHEYLCHLGSLHVFGEAPAVAVAATVGNAA